MWLLDLFRKKSPPPPQYGAPTLVVAVRAAETMQGYPEGFPPMNMEALVAPAGMEYPDGECDVQTCYKAVPDAKYTIVMVPMSPRAILDGQMYTEPTTIATALYTRENGCLGVKVSTKDMSGRPIRAAFHLLILEQVKIG